MDDSVNLFDQNDNTGTQDQIPRQDEEQLTIPGVPVPEKDPEQLQLLDVGHWWDEKWKGMPEFVIDDQAPYRTVYVHFRNSQDVRAFAELINQQITQDTLWVWYPEEKRGKFNHKKWIDSDHES